MTCAPVEKSPVERTSGSDEVDEGEPEDRRQERVRRRAGQRDEHALVARAAQPSDVHRDGLGPAEEADRPEGQEGGDDQRADRVDVDDGVQRQPARSLGGVVAERVGHDAMRHLVQDDRRHHDTEDDDLRCVVMLWWTKSARTKRAPAAIHRARLVR